MSDKNEVEGKILGIHTLESDLASAVMNEDYGKNIIKIVTDPSKNSLLDTGIGEEVQITKGPSRFGALVTKKNILITGTVIFLLTSAGVILYILNKAKNVGTESPEPVATSSMVVSTSTETLKPVIRGSDLLNPEVIQSVDFSNLNRNEFVAEINKIKASLSDKKIAPNNNIGINPNLNVAGLFEKIKYSGDAALIRSLTNIYAFGLYATKDGQYETYLLIKVNDFDLAFKSMLDWEKYMPVDLKDIFIGNNEIKSNEVASTTRYYKKDTLVFMDKTLKN